MYFPGSGCVGTLRTLYVYATGCKHSLGVANYNCVCALLTSAEFGELKTF